MKEEKSCSCGHCDIDIHDHNHDHDHGGPIPKSDVVRMLIALVLVACAAWLPVPDTVSLIGYLAAYILAGYPVLLKSISGLRHRDWLDENFLMLIATFAAWAIGAYGEAAAVMIFYGIGGIFEDMAVNRSRHSIESLMEIKPDKARKLIEGIWTECHPEDVAIGDLIQVQAGERLPLDGTVEEGFSSLDTSAITGESMYTEVVEGSEVYAGAVNVDGVLTIRTTRTFSDSTVSRILELVEKASQQKAETEKFITRFAKYYTPAVVGAAVLLAVLPPLLTGDAFTTWLYRAAIFLVVSCPCGLVISVPLGYFGGIGNASKHGILVKGGNFLEVLQSADAVVLDKTGTLTKGHFEVTFIEKHADADEAWGAIGLELILEIAAQLERHSSHPIAKSIVRAFQEKLIDDGSVRNIKEHKGKGMSGLYRGNQVHAGNAKLMEELGFEVPFHETHETVVFVATASGIIGDIHLSDVVKADAEEGIEELRKLGIKDITILTGDRKESAAFVADKVGIDSYHAELLPHDKVARFEDMLAAKGSKDKGHILYVGGRYQ